MDQTKKELIMQMQLLGFKKVDLVANADTSSNEKALMRDIESYWSAENTSLGDVNIIFTDNYRGPNTEEDVGRLMIGNWRSIAILEIKDAVAPMMYARYEFLSEDLVRLFTHHGEYQFKK